MKKNLVFQLLVILFFGLFSSISLAQNLDHQQNPQTSLRQFGEYILLNISFPNSKIYWRNPGEIGLASQIELKSENNNLAQYQILWPIPQIETIDNVTSYVYHNQANFLIKFSTKNPDLEAKFKINISYTLCNQSCTSFNQDFFISAKPPFLSQNYLEIEELLRQVPLQTNLKNPLIKLNKITLSANKDIARSYNLIIDLELEKPLLNPKLYLDISKDFTFDPLKFEYSNQQLIIPLKALIDHPKLKQVYFALAAENLKTYEFTEKVINENNLNFLLLLLYAFFGGIILNFMPCVLPILALKAYQITKFYDQKNTKTSLIFYALGIICCFVGLALITFALQQFGHSVGFGMHFQQPYYLITMVLILSVLTIYILKEDKFILNAPQWLNNKALQSTSFFFSGVLSTLIAIPCTAPLVTIAIGFALTTSFLMMLVIFTFIGLGMSLPYFLLALKPNLMKFIPKAGPWIDIFKKTIAVTIYLTVLWLIYIIYTQLGLKIATMLFMLTILLKYILGDNETYSNKTKAILLFIIIILAYILPYQLRNENTSQDLLVDEVWRDYQPEKISSLIEQGNIVLVNVTASWCSTCIINKFTTIENQAVLNFLVKNHIIAMRADISSGNNPQINTLMRMHRHFGIPLDLVYSKKFPHGVILSNILTPTKLINAIKNAQE